MEAVNKNILLAGEIVAKRWRVAEKIGEGTFSQIYSAFCLDGETDKVAIKVEAPSALKPVLEWESTILKSLQKCPYVCRYYYHGKHADSTVLVMELLGESMSMLRVSPEAIHGVPVSKCVAVGLEMLDAIEAFHKHGYVHRDIKASNFALNTAKPGSSSSAATSRRRYLLIDFGLSRQHLAEGKVIPARSVAEFRGTSMYASLSAHRRQELGPKDDLWSWFYLVLDFMRGELPWATDAQQKNRQTVFSLKEYYTERHPGLLVEGLPGGSHLLALVKYLMSLQYEDTPDYGLLRDRLRRAACGTEGEDTIELWEALSSDRERALQWTQRANDALQKNVEHSVLETLQSVAKKYNTFFDCEELNEDEHMAVQEAVFELETKLKESAQKFAPPPIQSFKRRQESEQKIRTDALRKRRERDQQIRFSIEQKLRRQASATGSMGSPANDVGSGSATPIQLIKATATAAAAVVGGSGSHTANPVHRSEDSSMDMSDAEEETATSTHRRHNGKQVSPGRVPPPPPAMYSAQGIQPRGPPPPGPSFPRPLNGNAHGLVPPPLPSPGGMPMFRPPPPPPPPSARQQMTTTSQSEPSQRQMGNGDSRHHYHQQLEHQSFQNRNGHGHGHGGDEVRPPRSRSRSRSYERPSHSNRRRRSRSHSRSPSQSRSRSRSRSPRPRHRSRSSRGRSRSRSSSRSPSRSRPTERRSSMNGGGYDDRRSSVSGSGGGKYDDRRRSNHRQTEKDDYHHHHENRPSPRDRDDRRRHGSRYER